VTPNYPASPRFSPAPLVTERTPLAKPKALQDPFNTSKAAVNNCFQNPALANKVSVPGCLEVRVDYEGNHFAEFSSSGLDDCQAACQSDDRCMGVNYKTDTGYCWLKTLFFGSGTVLDNRHAMPKFCLGRGLDQALDHFNSCFQRLR